MSLEQQLHDTVQSFPDGDGGALDRRILSTYTERDPLLPPVGTYSRERALFRYYHDPHAGIFSSAVANIAKRVQATPWEIETDEDDADALQELLLTAGFGGWDRFIAQLVLDRARYDQGTFIEIMGAGDPAGPLVGPATGIAILDSLRCYLTGNPIYPVIYWSSSGTMHRMHYTRVVQLVDMPETDESLIGCGQSALSRAIGAVHRQILMERYLDAMFDDKPMPGFVMGQNITEKTVENAYAKMERQRSVDADSPYGRNVFLFGSMPEHPVKLEGFSFSQSPPGFDPEQYTMLNARQVAHALGVAFEDVWGELSHSGLGSGTQSEILHAKATGRAFGSLLKQLERIINQLLPKHARFRWKYEDPQKDAQTAQIAQTYANTLALLGSLGLGADELRLYAAQNMPGMLEVLTDRSGQLETRSDADPVPPDDDEDNLTIAPDAAAVKEMAGGIVRRFAREHNRIVDMAADGVNAVILRSLFRDAVRQAAEAAYRDGVIDGGGDPGLAPVDQAVGRFLAANQPYIAGFIDRITAEEVNGAAEKRRADMWGNKTIRVLYYSGLAHADSGVMKRWVIGPTEEHCTTCTTLNGQVHPLKAYMDRGLYPGSQKLDCRGFNCECRLEDVPPGTSSRGRLPFSPPGLLDRIVRVAQQLSLRGS